MRNLIFSLVICSLLACNKSNSQPGNPVTPPVTNTYTFIRGLDLSFTPEIASYNISYKDNGTTKDILTIAKSKGINTIRLRLWNNPATAHSSLTEIMAYAKQIKAAGLQFWLDFHYSDTWADPGAQSKPAAWNGLNFTTLQDSLYNYTKAVLLQLQQNNVTPDYVETGNEINSGFLWNEGKIMSATDANWGNFILLLKQAIKATREVAPNAKIIIHIAGYDYAQQYYTNLQNAQTDYDIIGLSYYPWWHGKDLNALEQNIKTISTTFKKPVLIAETAYPFTFGYNDYTNNIAGSADKAIDAYPGTPIGQAQFITTLVGAVKKAVTNNNFGVCYWAPDWVAFKGSTATDGSPWENLSLFDFNNNALQALDSLGKH
ncbi:glycoside hydrolase family 53 protein [Limnovirga soli]|uniref:Arabinogalactan endo-beta-1,4-galactanase n=1 Tax=Limnovirga soli TaxID=2656915 RepID=A0A8J8FG52_9BACT|nr:glycosyl hydrolase 53 family protein [Limnovirga soli]NNV57536.1 arabinogalactan endo-1,4-beta-galactosidase [Limnovirga soli]